MLSTEKIANSHKTISIFVAYCLNDAVMTAQAFTNLANKPPNNAHMTAIKLSPKYISMNNTH